jgi:hypothetical protein
LPIKSMFDSAPQPAGTIVMPHGEFRWPPEIRRRWNVPSCANTSMKPWPAPGTSS